MTQAFSTAAGCGSRVAEGRGSSMVCQPRTEPKTTLFGGLRVRKTFRPEGCPAQDVRAAVICSGKAEHKVGSGYTTSAEIRRVLGY